MLLVVGGMIGLGKSSVAKILGEHFNSEVFYESVDDNPLLPLFYSESEEEIQRKRYPFLLQLYFLNTRFKSIKEALVNDNNKDLEIGDISVNVPAGSEKNYTITYNPNTQDVVENMTLSGIKIEGTDSLIADAPTRTGYIFTGWNTSSDGEGTNYEAGSTYSDNADLNLYAQWQIISSTLSVNPNGGELNGSTEEQKVEGIYKTDSK